MMHKAFVILSLVACGGGQAPPPAEPIPLPRPVQAAPQRQSPPASAAARDISFPPITRSTTDAGLEINAVEWRELPIVYLKLVIKSGAQTDPENLPGLSDLVASMLREGTKHKTSAQLAEAIEFLGADLTTTAEEDILTIEIRALAEHLQTAMDLLAEVALEPAFSQRELDKLKRRELDRIALEKNDPGFLAHREFARLLYGPHPYAHIDTTEEAVGRLRRADLARWHATHVVPSNAIFVAVGAVTPDQIGSEVRRAFARWRSETAREAVYPPPPQIAERQVLIVDRPESVQSVIWIGNLGLERANPDYVKLRVANQVLGGSAAARLFMDLRERRSLTYGAYSTVGEAVSVGMFRASASVRNEVTPQAMAAFFEHLERIVTEAPPEEELRAAQRYLSDSFPLQIDTPGKIADLVADLRVYGLPDNYWDTFRSSIRAVTPEESLTAAQQYIHPDKCIIVVVGRAADLVGPLRTYGPVTVVDQDGKPVRDFQPTHVPSEDTTARPDL